MSKMPRFYWIAAVGALLAALAAVAALSAAAPPPGGGPSDAVSSDQPRPNTPGSPTVPPGMVTAPAPIEGVEIAVMESYPPRYLAQVVYGLPSGCAQPGGHEVRREGDTVRITVSILQPADPKTICTMIYRTETVNVPLGSDFESGKTYTVVVNDTVKKTFTAQ